MRMQVAHDYIEKNWGDPRRRRGCRCAVHSWRDRCAESQRIRGFSGLTELILIMLTGRTLDLFPGGTRQKGRPRQAVCLCRIIDRP